MSVEASAWAWRQPLPMSRKFILLALADHADKTGICWPSIETLVDKTGTSRATVYRALSALEQSGYLEKQDDWWRLTVRQMASHSETEKSQRETKKSQNENRSNKGTISRTTKEPSRRRNPLSYLLADLIEQNGSKRPRVSPKWAAAERLMIDADARDPAEAEALIRWCQADDFWRSVILSMPKFRLKFDQLRLTAQRQNGHGSPGIAQAHRFADMAREALEEETPA